MEVPQQWCLASPVGPDLIPGSLSCGVLLPSMQCSAPQTMVHHSVAPQATQPTLALPWSLNVSARPLPDHLRLWCPGLVVQMLHTALTLLCSPLSSCCPFLHNFEVSLSRMISLSVTWFPRVWVPFLFNSSLSRVLVPS